MSWFVSWLMGWFIVWLPSWLILVGYGWYMVDREFTGAVLAGLHGCGVNFFLGGCGIFPFMDGPNYMQWQGHSPCARHCTPGISNILIYFVHVLLDLSRSNQIQEWSMV